MKYPQRGGHWLTQYGPESTAPKARIYLYIGFKANDSNDSRSLPVDMRAMLLLAALFLRLMSETACDQWLD